MAHKAARSDGSVGCTGRGHTCIHHGCWASHPWHGLIGGGGNLCHLYSVSNDHQSNHTSSSNTWWYPQGLSMVGIADPSARPTVVTMDAAVFGHAQFAPIQLVCFHLLQLSPLAILRCGRECIDLAIRPSFCLRLWCHAAAETVSERAYSGLPNRSQGQCLLGCPPLSGSYRTGYAASPHPAPDGLPALLARSGHVVRVAIMRSVYWFTPSEFFKFSQLTD